MSDKFMLKTFSCALLAATINNPVYAVEQATCDTIKTVGIGAAVGGVLAKVGVFGDKNKGKLGNILIGTGAGAAIYGAFICNTQAVSEQTKTSNQVEDEYKKRNKNKLPSNITVTEYATNTVQNGQVVSQINKSNEFEVVSRVNIIEGTSEKIQSVEERMQLVDVDGKETPLTPPKKLESSNSGEYKVTWTVPAAGESFKSGKFSVKKVLYVNGNEFKTVTSDFNVASSGMGVNLASNN